MTRSAKTTLSVNTLIRDKTYLSWIKKTPTLGNPHKTEGQPWRVYVLKKSGVWAKKDFSTYPQAFNWMIKFRRTYEDIVIHSKGQAFPPPKVKYQGKVTYWPSPKGYRWCPYCRRPTRFNYMRTHPSLSSLSVVVPDQKRCHVCGIRAENLPTYESSAPPTIKL